ncbi:hypothetical protein [Paraburkholderia ultramafica]|uniref:hypothetical protein n=1 Tax=Paraburkholderia ultramafica TaxID=1544867 RepID=UPI001FE27772|nr:hypothetical protein [Paraburkholderia ultramafica]
MVTALLIKAGSTLLCGGGELLPLLPWQAVSTIAAATTVATVRIAEATRDAGLTLIADVIDVIFAVSVIF